MTLGFYASRLPLLILICALAGCDIETTPTNAAAPDAGGLSDASLDCPDAEPCPALDPLAHAFQVDLYGIGTTWFDYQSKSHAIIPAERVYRAQDGSRTILFEILSYYDARGDSGRYTVRGRVMGVETESTTVALSANVKQGPVCLRFDGWQEVDCTSGDHDLVFRIEYRQVTGAGFAVANPAVYWAHRLALDDDTLQDPKVGLWRGTFNSVDTAAQALDDASAWARMKDVALRLEDSLLHPYVRRLGAGEASGAFIQANAAMKLVSWTLQKSTERYEITLRASCVDAALTPDAQQLPLSRDAVAQTLRFEPNTVNLISLCAPAGPTLVESTNVSHRGLWPPSDTYDLVVDTFADTLRLRVAPGHPLWSTGHDEVDESVVIPVELWD